MLLNYALVALGGALGSMLRAWGVVAVQTLTGAALPWGTIAINVIGSFVIGFFGTLTANDGRFAAPHDLRTFVMVGICGGFTTFSSFSLQTLELIRDGRPAAALGNVALSLVLCLASVAAGYGAAVALRGAPVGLNLSDNARHMVVAIARPVPSDTGVLAFARRLAPQDGGRLTLIAIESGQRDLVPSVDIPATRLRARWIAEARSELDTWIASCRNDGIDARLVTVRGSGALALLEHGRSTHLLLLDADSARGHARLFALAARTRRPVLLVPHDSVVPDGLQAGQQGCELATLPGMRRIDRRQSGDATTTALVWQA
ncbi:protein CrcB [Endobacter medicaginis]|uniref:Fluoride-specific ion channel FluC n=3 Tax=Endobacter medicaginis TaxID=1181271 RepID=A0A839UZ47_9PROT|nr:protein CrcB [Endobacter medicaginis]